MVLGFLDSLEACSWCLLPSAAACDRSCNQLSRYCQDTAKIPSI